MPSFSSPVDTTSLIIYDLALALIAVLLPYFLTIPKIIERYTDYGSKFFLNESSSQSIV